MQTKQTTTPAPPTINDLEAKLEQLRAERDDALNQVRALGAEQHAATRAFNENATTAALIHARTATTAEAKAQVARERARAERAHAARMRELDGEMARLSMVRQRLDAELDELPGAIHRRRQADERASGAGDVAALTSALQEATDAHIGLVAELGAVEGRRVAAFVAGDVAAVRRAQADGIELPIKVAVAWTAVLRARAPLARARVADIASGLGDLEQRFTAAQARVVDAVRERDLANAALGRATATIKETEAEARRAEAELAAHLRSARSAAA